MDMNLRMKELIGVMSSKNGDKLFEKATEILGRFGITTKDSDGNIKDLYTVVCEVVEVWNKEK